MKARQLHELPLSQAAFAILDARKLTATGDLVFPSREGAPFSIGAVCSRAFAPAIGESRKDRGTTNSVSRHSTRLCFSHLAEVAEDGGFDLDLLDQFWPIRAAAYLGLSESSRWAERVRAINRWSVLIAGAEPDSNVVPIRARS